MMCGIAGFIGQNMARAKNTLGAMTNALQRRGPDGVGHWHDPNAGVALGHRRLSVVDIGPNGDQPMLSHDGRFVLVYNGEIYNTTPLRADIEARRGSVQWRGHCDSEVLLELLVEFGVPTALKRIDGMFAFALFDRKTRALTLARDAFGEKPLFYGSQSGQFTFASQVTALRCVPGFKAELDQNALAQYFKYSYIPAPLSIYQDVYKLPPGHFLTVTAEQAEKGQLPEPVAFWEASKAALQAQTEPFSGSYEQAKDQLEQVLFASVTGRMVSDVPLGCLLSGGIDSSAVAALMTKVSGRKVQSFCIGMQEESFNEAQHAREVARYLGTDHTELLLSAKDVLSAVPLMPEIYDEPFADSSQIPTYLVSKMARQQVTVALSGDGGDEVLGGYNRYIHGPNLWAKLQRIPAPLRRISGQTLGAIPVAHIDQIIRAFGRFGPAELRAGRPSEKVKKLARLLAAASETEFRDHLISVSPNSERVLNSGLQVGFNGNAQMPRLAQRMMLDDTLGYLPSDILTKVDRAAMYCSLETRTPFLNRDLFNFAWSLPEEMKINGGQGKRILRDVLYKHVPQAMVDRPKSGFAVPIGRWMRTELRDWAEAGLSPQALARSGVLNADEVQKRWREHVSGKQDHDGFLWSVLMFQAWHDRHMVSGNPKTPKH